MMWATKENETAKNINDLCCPKFLMIIDDYMSFSALFAFGWHTFTDTHSVHWSSPGAQTPLLLVNSKNKKMFWFQNQNRKTLYDDYQSPYRERKKRLFECVCVCACTLLLGRKNGSSLVFTINFIGHNSGMSPGSFICVSVQVVVFLFQRFPGQF